MTVFRKLAALSYLSSYSHRGAYYTLPPIARFDTQGLWSCREVWFSRHGTLLDTLVAWVSEAPAGYFAGELQTALHVAVKDPLRTLVERGRLSRHALQERWLYCSADRARQREQRLARQGQIEAFPLAHLSDMTVSQGAELKAAVVLFYSLLDEQQRRLFAGLESFKCGHGGDTLLAGLLGLDPDTVARGRRELLAGEVQRERIRMAGGGRPRAEKNSAALETAASPAQRLSGRRPHGASSAAYAPATAPDRSSLGRCRAARQPKHRTAPAGTTGYCTARQPQGSLPLLRCASGPAVPAHRPSATALCPREPAHHQRRYQEKGAGGLLQECGPAAVPDLRAGYRRRRSQQLIR